MSVIDNYLKSVPSPQKEELGRVRQIIAQTLPDVEEVITYGMPGFKYKKKYLISFAAFKDHLSIFPGAEVVETLQNKLNGYKTSKGTIQFTLQKPLSETLLKEVVSLRANAINQG